MEISNSATKNSFTPAWWLRNPHLQTLWPHLLRFKLRVETRRERLELPDGDFVDLNWTLNSGTVPDATYNSPIVIVLHGLQGSVRSSYASGLLRAIENMGWRGVFMHFRGCSGEPNRLARCYHAGETEDFATLVEVLRQREPHTPLAAVGFSLGGNVLLKWLGEIGERAPLQAAVAVSVPFDLANSVRRINQGLSRAYQLRLLRGLRNSIQQKFKHIATPENLGDLRRLRSIRDYDGNVTAPLHGFADADDYYTRSSSRQYLKNIRVPTLILHAADDPFMTAQAIPEFNELSSSTRLELSKRGGHLGFVGGKYPWKPDYWLEARIPEFLRAALGSSADEMGNSAALDFSSFSSSGEKLATGAK